MGEAFEARKDDRLDVLRDRGKDTEDVFLGGEARADRRRAETPAGVNLLGKQWPAARTGAGGEVPASCGGAAVLGVPPNHDQ